MPSASERIRRVRRKHGLTQKELARRSHTSQPAINRYERGKSRPSRATLERILRSATKASLPSESLREHREQVLALLEKAGAGEVFLFGSVTRGEDRSDSDIDLLVDKLDPSNYSWGVPIVQEELTQLLGFEVEVGEIRYMRPRVLDEVLRDACLL